MSQQTEISKPMEGQKSKHTKTLHKIKYGLKNYWPLILLTQLPLIILSIFVLNAMKPFQKFVLPSTKKVELQNEQIKTLENHIKNLNEKILYIQNQYAEDLSKLKATNNLQNQTSTTTNVDQSKRQILETLDRIGEKIRLNEPFAGLLATLPKDCVNFPGYKTLYRYSSKLPLTFLQLKKIFDDIYKAYMPPKQTTNIHPWLAKFASLFRGRIKVERIQNAPNPLLPIYEALDMHDLRSALLLTKGIDFPTLKLWKNLVQERILLEDEYSVFVEKTQTWLLNQTITENSISQAANMQKENNL